MSILVSQKHEIFTDAIQMQILKLIFRFSLKKIYIKSIFPNRYIAREGLTRLYKNIFILYRIRSRITYCYTCFAPEIRKHYAKLGLWRFIKR